VTAAHANPFRVSAMHSLRIRLSDGRLRSLCREFERRGRRGSLVGPQGSGKSTLLAEIAGRYEDDGWRVVRIVARPGGRRRDFAEVVRATTAVPTLVAIDGYERLGWWARCWLCILLPSSSGLLVTAHRSVGLPVLYRHVTSVELLADLAQELTSRQGHPAVQADMAQLFARHRGNIRECLFDLYDRWSGGAQQAAMSSQNP